VKPNIVQEIGWHEVKQSVQCSPWLADLPPSFEAFHWHGEIFDIPEGAAHLLESRWCRNQAFAHGRMLALQFHVEMTVRMVKEWGHLYREQLTTPSTSIQSFDAMISDLEIRTKVLHSIADIIYGRWLSAVTDDVPFI
jgi:GMP synthase-like glutamine amidotransferase